jgi:hypothetical protein
MRREQQRAAMTFENNLLDEVSGRRAGTATLYPLSPE